jgi:hypothetical protein
MRSKLILFISFAVMAFGCKKDKTEDLTAYRWVLSAQTVNPEMTIGNKTSKNYLSMQNPEGCTKNFTYRFSTNGTYSASSNGALCDMLANSDKQVWSKEGNVLTLALNGFVSSSKTLTITNNTLIEDAMFEQGGKTYQIKSIYKPK